MEQIKFRLEKSKNDVVTNLDKLTAEEYVMLLQTLQYIRKNKIEIIYMDTDSIYFISKKE